MLSTGLKTKYGFTSVMKADIGTWLAGSIQLNNDMSSGVGFIPLIVLATSTTYQTAYSSEEKLLVTSSLTEPYYSIDQIFFRDWFY